MKTIYDLKIQPFESCWKQKRFAWTTSKKLYCNFYIKSYTRRLKCKKKHVYKKPLSQQFDWNNMFPRILIVLKSVLHYFIKSWYLICQNTWPLILWKSCLKNLLWNTNNAQLDIVQFIFSPRNHLFIAGASICLWKNFVEKSFPMKNFRYN